MSIIRPASARLIIKAYASVAEARLDMGAWLSFYNDERKHQALGYRTPDQIHAEASPVDMCTTQARCTRIHRANNKKAIQLM